MANPFDGFSDNELQSGKSPDDISEDGMYLFKVVQAFDSYKVNPEERDDPEESRRIKLRVRVLDAVQNKRGEGAEMEEDVEYRAQQRGNTADISLWLDKDGNASLIDGNMKILAMIAGSTPDDKPDEDLLREYHKGTDESGDPMFELGQIADQMQVNCSSLLGRDFIAIIEDTDEEYPSFFPWYAESIEDENQTPFDHPETDGSEVQVQSPLFSGTDHASKRMKEIFDQGNGSSGSTEKKEAAYAGESSGGGDPDDGLPF